MITHTSLIPPGIPERYHAALDGRTIRRADLPAAISASLRSSSRVPVSGWAAAHRAVTDGPHAGPWRHQFAPHTVQIMDTYSMPWVREVWFCGVEQSGKTNTMLNCLGWAIDCDPGNVFYLMPSEETAKRLVGKRLRPMLSETPVLRRLQTGRADDISLDGIKLANNVNIFPAWANSPSSIASWPAKHCFADEVDKFPAMSGREASPLTLLRKRSRLYRGRHKHFFSSTPAGMFIAKGVRRCQQVWEYRLRCPHCAELIKPGGEHLHLPPGATAADLPTGLTGLICPHCAAIISADQHQSAIRHGRWLAVKGADLRRPATVGFHHRAFDCLDIDLDEIAKAWLEARDGGHAEKVAWANGYDAIDYVADRQDRPEDAIFHLADDRPPRLVPGGGIIAALTAGVDTQDQGFYYEIRAWGWGLSQESWQIRAGFCASLAALSQVLFDDAYQDAAGLYYPVHLAMIDSGGHRTGDIYDYARANVGRVQAYKGASGRRANPRTETIIDRYPGTRLPIPGGVRLIIADSHHYKDDLSRRLSIRPDDPGAWHLLAEVQPDTPHGKDFVAQMCAEFVDERGNWKCPEGRANHYWDCSVLNLIAADILQIKYWKQQEHQ